MIVKNDAIFQSVLLMCLFQSILNHDDSKLIPLMDISCHKIVCYDGCDNILPTLSANYKPARKSIYFLETSCNGRLNSRQACSIESAARANQNRKIVVLFAGPLFSNFTTGRTYRLLKARFNIHFYRLNISNFVKRTPLQIIFSNKTLQRSKYPVTHTSDLLRILTLYKYGGIYLDMDTIVMKSFDSLPNSFTARENNKAVNTAVLGLAKNKIGKEIAKNTLRILSKSYNPYKWPTTNRIFLRTLQEVCQTQDIMEFNERTCKGFHVFPPEMFYPIKYSLWRVYYSANTSRLPQDLHTTFIHHFWNQLGYLTPVAPTSYYAKLAQKYCPKVYNLYKNNFGQ